MVFDMLMLGDMRIYLGCVVALVGSLLVSSPASGQQAEPALDAPASQDAPGPQEAPAPPDATAPQDVPRPQGGLVPQTFLALQDTPATQPGSAKDKEPPAPYHSGWGTLASESLHDFGRFPQRKSTWVILGIGGAGALLAHQADAYVQSHIVGSDTAEKIFAAGKWIGSAEVQVGTAVGLYLVGRYLVAPQPDGSRTNKATHLGFDLIRAQILSQAIVAGIKYSVQRDRPTGECCAFPSGHAATAFAAASVIERHFGYKGAWPTMLAASYVAASRLVDNRHYLSDVVFGSAVGMATGWTVVGGHGRDIMGFVPTPVPIRGGMVLAFNKITP
jgi:PAP2 superfamily protein